MAIRKSISILLSLVLLAFAQSDAVKTVPPSLFMELLTYNNDLETNTRPRYRTPSAIIASPDKKSLYVAEKGLKKVVRIDAATQAVTKTMLMPNEPTGIVVSPDGATLFVTCSSEQIPWGVVVVVDAATGAVKKRIPAGHSARAPAISSDGSKLYVCNLFDNTVSVIDVAAGRVVKTVKVTREPYAAALTPDNGTLVITNALPDQKATDTMIACKVTLLDTKTLSVRSSVSLPPGSHSLFGIAITPDGKYALATHLIGRFTIPALTITMGWVHSNNLAIIDIANSRLLNDVELDYASTGLANPWGLAITEDGGFVCILHAGTNQMSILNLPRLIELAKGGKDLSHDFTATKDIKSVYGLRTRSPRELAMIGNKAYVAGYFSDSLDVVTVTPVSNSLTASATMASLRLGEGRPMTAERKGEANFCDASLCLQKWQSCFSCHPFTRPDALNWILNTTMSFSKNAKSMLYSWWTPPTSWAGKRAHAGGPQGSIRSGISAELFTEPSEEIARPLDTFLMRLKPVPSPHLVKGRLSASAKRGEKIYTQVNCDYCHAAPLYHDPSGEFHNAGVPDNTGETNTQWDSPSLIEAWRTAPYGHLGSYENIADIIKLRGHSIGASQLSSQDLQDLVEFVLSL